MKKYFVICLMSLLMFSMFVNAQVQGEVIPASEVNNFKLTTEENYSTVRVEKMENLTMDRNKVLGEGRPYVDVTIIDELENETFTEAQTQTSDQDSEEIVVTNRVKKSKELFPIEMESSSSSSTPSQYDKDDTVNKNGCISDKKGNCLDNLDNVEKNIIGETESVGTSVMISSVESSKSTAELSNAKKDLISQESNGFVKTTFFSITHFFRGLFE